MCVYTHITQVVWLLSRAAHGIGHIFDVPTHLGDGESIKAYSETSSLERERKESKQSKRRFFTLY